MKVTGPSSGTPALPEAPEGAAADRVLQGDSVSPGEPTSAGPATRPFAERLSEPSASGAAGAAPSPNAITADLAAQLAAGQIDAGAAVEQVVERVLTRQLGADAPPALCETLRAALRDALETDPLLAEKLRAL